MRFIGMAVLVAALAGFALAGGNAPEIDASSGAAALGLLAGAVLILRARKRKVKTGL